MKTYLSALAVCATTFLTSPLQAQETIEISLDRVKDVGTQYCSLYVSAKSTVTKYNLTKIIFEVSFLEKDGSTFEKGTGSFERLKAGSTAEDELSFNSKERCSVLGGVKFRKLNYVYSDGDQYSDDKSLNIVEKMLRFSSNVDGIEFVGPNDKKQNQSKSEKKESTNNKKPAAGKLNPLESALNPFYGTRQLWDDFVEDGGLNKINGWFGVNVDSAQLSFDKANNVKEISITTSKQTSVKQIRNSINRLCKFNESDWKKTSSSENYISGQAENAQCKAVYLPQNDQYWTFSVSRIQER